MRRWSLRQRALALHKASARSGAASSRPRPHATSSPSGWACRSRRSRCTSRCSAAGLGASPSPTTGSRRPCSPRRWTASRSRSCGRATTICTTTISIPCPSNISKPASMRKENRSRGCIAPSRRRSCPPSMRAPSRRRIGSLAWASSTSPSPFPTFASRIRKRSRIRASAGSAPYRIFRMRSRCSRSSRSWPPQRAATRRTSCSRSSGPPRVVIAADAGRHVEPRRIARALPRGHRPPAARGRAGREGGATGADRCPRVAGSASPRTTVSSVTSRRSWRSRSTPRAS